MKKSLYFSAEEAATALEIRKDTLYAYVSRGRLRSVEVPHQKARGYLREDVEQLQQRKRLRQHPAQEIQQALHWGIPLVRSNVSHLSEGQLFYRHQPLPTVVKDFTLEQLIALLWQTPEVDSALYWQSLQKELSLSEPHARAVTPTVQVLSHLPEGISWFHQMQISLSVWTAQDRQPEHCHDKPGHFCKATPRIWRSVHGYIFKGSVPSIPSSKSPLQDLFRFRFARSFTTGSRNQVNDFSGRT